MIEPAARRSETAAEILETKLAGGVYSRGL
jgi:hypothetical protein